MADRKTERMMNLMICLLMARRYVPREKIRASVEGYRGLSDAAFERSFERDKDELRALGIPIETGSNDVLFPDEVGYRISRTDFELPPVDFTPAETAMLALASGVWDQARQAEEAVRAMATLRAAGVEPDARRTAGLAASMTTREASFDPLWQAVWERRRVRFRYRDRDRHVEPWTLRYRRGAWYLIGNDLSRGEGRSFKLARIQDAPSVDADSGEYDLPDADVIEKHVASLEPQVDTLELVLALREGSARHLPADPRPTDAVGVPAGYRAVRIDMPVLGDLVGELASWGADALVLEPREIRDAVVAHLMEVAQRWP